MALTQLVHFTTVKEFYRQQEGKKHLNTLDLLFLLVKEN